MSCGSDCFLMRATAGSVNISNVVDLYDIGTGRWSTAQLSQARTAFSATSVGTVAMFAGGLDGKLLRIVFCCEGVLIEDVRCVMGTLVFVFRDAVLERFFSYARHCRFRVLYQCCGLVRQQTASSCHLFLSATFSPITHSSPSNHIQPAAPLVSSSHLLYPRLLRLRGVRLLRRLLLLPRE